MRVVAFSDFHLFARRSRGEKLLSEVVAMVTTAEADSLIICGDLFDFRWSESASIDDACVRAVQWLEKLVSLLGETNLVYILGNHDGIEEFVPYLERLESKYKRFTWRGDYYQIGSTLFLHGDIPMKSKGERLGPRTYKVGETIKGKILNHMYDVITVTRTVNLYRKCVDANRKIPFLIKALKADATFAGVEYLVFGHSHHAFDTRVVDGIECINLGTGVVGYRFNPKTLEV